ncbi:MAG TPA: glycosyltransferase family 4 protein, partial [Rhodanobacteraceae bacterium]|nr:glycosyltransferase family 4 protein [Rhodanobacteraceae bacterium]
MKIAMLVAGGLDRSGVERVVPCLLWLIERLVRGGDEVHVFVFRTEPQPGTWRLCGATIHNAGRKHSAKGMFSQVIAEHRRAPFDVIHTSSVVADLIGVLCGKILKIPSLIYFGNTELISIEDIPTARSSWLGRAYLRLAVMGADRILAQSEHIVRQARAFNITATRVPLGVALDKWPPASPRPRDTRRSARLLHVGSIIPIRDHDMLLDTAAHLKSSGVAFEIDAIGDDVLRNDSARRRAEALGLSDRIRFHGFLPHHELRPFFERADLLIVTSRHEAGPIVALEAAVCGVPVVGTNVGHLAEWAPMAARVVEPRDSAGLARAIIDLLSDDDARIELAGRAQ